MKKRSAPLPEIPPVPNDVTPVGYYYDHLSPHLIDVWLDKVRLAPNAVRVTMELIDTLMLERTRTQADLAALRKEVGRLNLLAASAPAAEEIMDALGGVKITEGELVTLERFEAIQSVADLAYRLVRDRDVGAQFAEAEVAVEAAFVALDVPSDAKLADAISTAANLFGGRLSVRQAQALQTLINESRRVDRERFALQHQLDSATLADDSLTSDDYVGMYGADPVPKSSMTSAALRDQMIDQLVASYRASTMSAEVAIELLGRV